MSDSRLEPNRSLFQAHLGIGIYYDGLTAKEIVEGINSAVLIENYPKYPKGACVLVLQLDRNENPIHVVWGVPAGYNRPAVLITAYRPDPQRWNGTFTERTI